MAILRILVNTIKKYPLSTGAVATIWVLCFCSPPHTPLAQVSMIDKWVHMLMYFITCNLIWCEYALAHKNISFKKGIGHSWGLPILMSGLIELLQAYYTNGRRNGDWLDMAANSLGATLAIVSGILLATYLSKRKRG
ncbi:MAG TPA: VanZ family protein [Prevotella sp.]